MKQQRTDIVERRAREHDQFLTRFVERHLLKVCEDYWGVESVPPNLIWREPYFTREGIILERPEHVPASVFGKRVGVVSQPDLVCCGSRGTPALIVVEAKLSAARSANLVSQLETDRGYVVGNPEHVLRFLHEQGLGEDYISEMPVFFSGVVAGNRGCRQYTCLKLFEE